MTASNISSETNPSIEVIVADDGPGISAENIDRVFEPFFTTKRDVGTGLGLWATKTIVERHGGTIAIRPPSDGVQGAAFILRLPRNSPMADGGADIVEL